MDQTSDEYMAEHGQQIGRLVIGVGLFDNDITSVISQSLRLNRLQENALVRPMQTRAKADLLLRIGKMFLKPHQAKKLAKWNKAVADALDDRNSLIHGSPGHRDGKVHFRTWTGKNRMLGKAEAWPVERVSVLGDTFLDLDEELNNELLPLFKPTFAPAAPLEGDGSPDASTQTPLPK